MSRTVSCQTPVVHSSSALKWCYKIAFQASKGFAAHAPARLIEEKLICYVLTQPPDRASYRTLTPTDEDLQQIHDMTFKVGILDQPIKTSDLIDRQFIPQDIKPADIDAR